MKTRLAAAALLCVLAVSGQQSRPLPAREAMGLYGRTVELMEAASVASPELARAAAPLVENTRQALAAMRTASGQNAALVNTLLANVRVFALVADAAPRPDEFKAEAAKQLAEVRENLARIDAHFRALLEQKEAQLANPDWANLARYADANTKTGAPVPGRPRVVFLGDSITDGWRLNEYFPDRDFVNRGISGQITGQMLGRMKADVIDLRPAAMLVLAGTNDIARGVPLAGIENNLTMIADLAQAAGIRPLFASVLPIHDYNKDKNPAFEMSRRRPPAAIRALNDWIQNFCRTRGYTYVDYFSALVDKAGYLKAELADDGLHPNAAGYRIMAPIAQQAIDTTLAALEKGKKKRR